MNEIIRHIEFLLVTHDCVVIPGFGAVLAHSLPSHFDASSDVLLPPSRTFSFNISLKHDDGLLVSSIARSKTISFESARAIVGGEVDAMHRSLVENGQLALGAIGRLIYNNDVVSFEPSTAAALSPDYMWLTPLSLIGVSDMAKRRAIVASSQISFTDYLMRTARVAASVAMLFLLGFVLTTPIKLDNAQYASLGLDNFQTQKNHLEEASSLVQLPGRSSAPIVLHLKSYDDLSLSVDTAAHAQYIRDYKAKAIADKNNDVLSNNSLRLNPQDKYFLIVASLTTQSDAEEFIANSKFKQLGILVKDGRYRIYAATGSNISEVQSASESLADSFPSSWICRN